jgi:cilla- and flagella-associated protein
MENEKFKTIQFFLNFSVNEITSLKYIQYCKNLSELYIRNNSITDLDEIFYLKDLKNLKILWLADNECALNLNDSNYRFTVLR